eukprot:11872615-Ditylum_brightwellii.AAC.1
MNDSVTLINESILDDSLSSHPFKDSAYTHNIVPVDDDVSIVEDNSLILKGNETSDSSDGIQQIISNSLRVGRKEVSTYEQNKVDENTIQESIADNSPSMETKIMLDHVKTGNAVSTHTYSEQVQLLSTESYNNETNSIDDLKVLSAASSESLIKDRYLAVEEDDDVIGTFDKKEDENDDVISDNSSKREFQ